MSGLQGKNMGGLELCIEWSKKSGRYDPSSSRRPTKDKPELKCRECGRRGHMSRDCPRKSRKHRSRSKEHRRKHKSSSRSKSRSESRSRSPIKRPGKDDEDSFERYQRKRSRSKSSSSSRSRTDVFFMFKTSHAERSQMAKKIVQIRRIDHKK